MLLKVGALLATAVFAEIPAVTELDVEAYLGRWYQMYASFPIKYSFELGGNCVTADYGATDTPGIISVTNIVRPSLLDRLPFFAGGVKVRGFAGQSQTEPGKLNVDFTSGDAGKAAYKEPGNYWIIKLGDKNADGKYDWAVVTDNKAFSLYILARDVARFRANDEAAVLAYVKEMGFTKALNKPLETNQDGCDYSRAPADFVEATA